MPNNPTYPVMHSKLELRSNDVSTENINNVDQRIHLSIQTLPLKSVKPVRCKPWKYHNRDGAWLEKSRCLDLIQSIQKNGQIEPALVREIDGEKDYDYEIIYGVRRWYACSQIPDQELLVRITNENDKICMILMHVENANSKDISEFERAFSFAEQVRSNVFKNQTELAEAVGLTQGTISKMVKAASIFEFDWIKRLFSNKLDIPVKKAYLLSILLKDVKSFESIRKESDILWVERETLRPALTSTEVLARLIKAAKTDQSKDKVESNEHIVSLRRKGDKFYIIIENLAVNLNLAEFENACLKAIKLYSNKLFPKE